ncbi:MAG TPA: MBL fold metallo-hydrolase [Acidisarcina sp.]|nr:MBL fold metallo-hydrolase [Acidisarcina sp.]
MRIIFWGAAQEVTGSMHEVQTNQARILLDCGLLQGKRQPTYERNSHFSFKPEDIHAVVLSHAHVDHSGNLPTLGKQGFGGTIYTGEATVDLCRYMLADSASLQERDQAFIERRWKRRKDIGMEVGAHAVPPLYTLEDVTRIMGQFSPLKYGQKREVAPGITTTLRNAGHMLGSAFVQLELRENGRTCRVLFSGDMGRKGLPILRNPEQAPAADYLILESTYGDRLHPTLSNAKEKLAEYIGRTIARGGRVIIPAFAVGRTQQLVFLLHQLMVESSLPEIPIFVDSPLALNVTEIFRRHPAEFDYEASQFLKDGKDPFGFARLRYLRSAEESKALNDLRTPFVVISSAGMCEGGRVLHHLKNGIEDPRNLILLAGYQAEHTLGRRIAERQSPVPIFGEPYALRAEVAMLDELSGHADQHDLVQWVRPIAKSLKKIFLVHGEPKAQQALEELLTREFAIPVVCPERASSCEI